MICEISIERLKEILMSLQARQKNDTLLSRLCSNAFSFLPHKLCTVYEVSDMGKAIGLMCLYGGSLTAFFIKKPNFSELANFLRFQAGAAKHLECDSKIAARLLKRLSARAVYGNVFVLKKQPKRFSEGYTVDESADVRSFFSALKSASADFADADFETYYCDVFYRKDVPARLFTVRHFGKIIATAAVLHIYEKNAVISDVTVHPDFRRRKIGSQLVSEVCEKLMQDGYIPSLLCTSPAAAALYKKIGFKKSRRFGLILLKDDV